MPRPDGSSVPRRAGLRARFRPGAGIDPVSAGRCAIIFEPGEAGQLLARLNNLLRGRIGQIGKRFAVDLPGEVATAPDAAERCIGQVRFRIGSGNLPPSFL